MDTIENLEDSNKFLQVLPKVNLQKFQQITYGCFDALCSRQGPLYTDFQDINCNEEEFQIVCSMIKTALYQCVKQNATSTKQQLSACWVDVQPAYLECLHKCLVSRPSDLQLLRTNIATSNMGPTMKDFDWNLKWILGSSNLASLQQVLFNLNLQLSSDAMQEHHSIEMDLTELSRLLSALEQARDSLESH